MTTDAVVHLIDDDEAVRHAIAFLLTTSGFAVRVHEISDDVSRRLAVHAAGLHRDRCPDARDGRSWLAA